MKQNPSINLKPQTKAMFDKLNALKQKMEDAKKRLDILTVTGTAADGLITVEMTANKEIKNIHIDNQLLTIERKDEMLDYLELAFNHAIQNANNVSETEMMNAGKDLLPNLPGLF